MRRLVTMRCMSAIFAGALLGLCVAACGGTSKATGSAADVSTGIASTGGYFTSTTSSVIPPGQPLRGDGDADNPSDIDGNGDSDSAAVGGPDSDNDNPTRASYSFPDSDDKATFAYGRSPSAAEERAISSVVKRYYVAASVGDGAAACSLLLTGFARTVPEAYGQTSGPAYLRGGKTCRAVMSMLFRHFRGQLREKITVVEVRVKGSNAQVVLSSRTTPAASVSVARQGSSWKIQELLGQPLP